MLLVQQDQQKLCMQTTCECAGGMCQHVLYLYITVTHFSIILLSLRRPDAKQSEPTSS